MEDFDPKEFLLFALHHFEIAVIDQQDNLVHLDHNYLIEIEGKKLYKLLHDGLVVAPFADVEELCSFIKMDMRLDG